MKLAGICLSIALALLLPLRLIAGEAVEIGGHVIGEEHEHDKPSARTEDGRVARDRHDHAEGEHAAGGHSHGDHVEHAHDAHDDHSGHDHGAHDAEHGGHREGDSVSVNIMGAYGNSSVDDDELEALQGGGHDPRRSGATLQQAEFVLRGDIGDARAEAHAVVGEDGVELEEAFLEATSHGSMRARLGYLLSPFGLVNQRHPHSWSWIDQPLANTRILGSEGARGWGGRFDFALGHDWDSRLALSAQLADDDTLVSFRGRGHVHGAEDHDHGAGGGEESLVEHIEETYGGLTVGNRPYIEDGGVLLGGRVSHAWSDGCDTRLQAGLSALYGPNASGADADTLVSGADFSLRWQPCAGQWPWLLWESEFMQRRYDAAAVFNDDDPAEVIDLPVETLRDSAWYTQVLHGFEPQWAAGLRYEQGGGSGDSIGGRNADPLRAERTRISPLLTWYGEENALRVRLQYNADQFDYLESLGLSRRADSLWLGIDFTLGDHGHADDPGLPVEVHAEEHDESSGGGHAEHGH